MVSQSSPRAFCAAFGASWALGMVGLGHAQTPSEDNNVVSGLVVYGREINLLGVAQAASEGVVGYRDFEQRPLSRVGELVETVPGVVATQHSGTGKANQYFLRGFNLDHGTDFAGFVDGAPINMRSHGHGQGYLDLNFLIPELVERIDYRKGPYYPDVGDFSAAGTVKFTTADRLAEPLLEATAGSFGYARGLLGGSAPVGGGELLASVEGVTSNGPWVLDEDLRKVNGLLKYSRGSAQEGWKLALNLYDADWTSTDQIPQRAVDQGVISRLGYIDPDLGGRTSRAALTGQWRRDGMQAEAYAIRYDFRLTSNFTYFLDDPVLGDEFQQRDRRTVVGGAVKRRFEPVSAPMPLAITVGADARYDDVGVIGLYRSVGGVPVATVREDSLKELSLAAYAQGEAQLTTKLRALVGVRADRFSWDVNAGLAENGGSGDQTLFSPKLALAWRLSEDLEAYADLGESFHSNDVRGATIRVDPVTGDPADRVAALVKARGGELGVKFSRLAFNASLVAFRLTLDSELVFVGDAGATEPNDASDREGFEASVFWRARDWLTIDASAAATKARFRNAPSGADHIPGAVSNVVAGGLTARLSDRLTSTVRLRHFGAAPLIEDNSVRSRPTTVVNVGGYYDLGRVRLGVDVLNLFNSKDADITYFYASQLRGETAPVEDLHRHPVEPFQIRASLRLALQ